MIDRATTKAIMAEAEAALQAIAEKHGLSVQRGNASFSSTEIKGSFTFNAMDDEGTINLAAKAQWEATAGMRRYKRIPDDWFLATFTDRGRQFQIIGISPRAHKNPLRIKDLDSGKEYRCNPAMVSLPRI